MSGTPPRRKHTPAVYRRRRLVVLLALIGVAALVWLLIAQPWRGNAVSSSAPIPDRATSSASSSPAPSTSPTSDPTTPSVAPTEDAASTPPAEPEADASPTPELTPTAKPCVTRDVGVEALADQETYTAGQNPQLSIRLTNNGATDCTLNVGTSAQAFTITSGTDVWWRSTDCQSEPSDMVVLLAAGQSVSSAAPLSWDRTRSSVSTCADTNRQTAPGGGASYHLSVEIGGIPSSQSTQLLLY